MSDPLKDPLYKAVAAAKRKPEFQRMVQALAEGAEMVADAYIENLCAELPTTGQFVVDYVFYGKKMRLSLSEG